ncbi:hypothetical protein DNTS_015269 [Danionella cerebrum]|uniref:ILEI/PANDER domain-containing protein n=1 Tax=Danionella cerebrum TaxID=2873325 RepID=A0A553MSJ4_9TELE|nr:hypothetical protein DNTS_015269 [Danionella translucida]
MMIYIRREIFKFLFMVAALIISISLVFKLLRVSPDVTLAHLMERSVEGAVMVQFKPDDQKNDDVEELIEFLESIKDGSLIKFRDNWVFVGGKKTIAEIYFEQHIKNDRETNKYDAWPEMIEMEGCIPKLD